jgi:hypothetical protein
VYDASVSTIAFRLTAEITQFTPAVPSAGTPGVLAVAGVPDALVCANDVDDAKALISDRAHAKIAGLKRYDMPRVLRGNAPPSHREIRDPIFPSVFSCFMFL